MKSIDKIKEIVLSEIRRNKLGEAYRERENVGQADGKTWQEIGDEIGVSKPGAMKIGDRALIKVAKEFLYKQIEELMDKLDAGEIEQDTYAAMLDKLMPIDVQAKLLVKKPEFVDYFKNSYFGEG